MILGLGLLYFLIIIKISSGWPHIKVLALPIQKIIPLVFVTLSSFLLPIIISCVIYLVLICKKRKLFENKIEDSNDGRPLRSDPTSVRQGHCSTSHRENLFQEHLDIGDNVQENTEVQITQNADIKCQRACQSNTNNQDELQISKFMYAKTIILTPLNEQLCPSIMYTIVGQKMGL